MTVGNIGFSAIIREIPGLVAAGDISAYQNKLVALSDDRTVTVASHAARAIGVLLNKPTAAGQAASVAGNGSIVKVKVAAAGALTYGQQIAPDTGNLGQAIVATTSDYPCGTVLVGGAAADEVPVLIQISDRVL